MPRDFTQETLDLKRSRLLELNNANMGLNSEDSKRKLKTLENFFSTAAAGLKADAGDKASKKRNELVLNLEKLATHLKNLQKDDVLEEGEQVLEQDRNSEFEEAMRHLADIPALFLDRDEEGTLLFELIGNQVKKAAGKDYDLQSLLNDVESLDRLFDLDFTGIRGKIREESGNPKKLQYLEQQAVASFKRDPDLRLAAQLMEDSSVVRNRFTDTAEQLNGAWDEKPKIVKNGIDILFDTVAQAKKSIQNPAACRSLMIQAAQQLKLLRKFGSNVKDFPPDTEKVDLDYADKFLDAMFDAKDPRVHSQLKALNTPGAIEIPQGIEPKQMAMHFASAEPGRVNDEKSDFLFLRLALLDLNQAVEGITKAKRSDPGAIENVRNFYNALARIGNVVFEDYPGGRDAAAFQNYAGGIIGVNFGEMRGKLEDFYRDGDPEDVSRVREIMDPLAKLWKQMDFARPSKRFEKQAEAYQPKASDPKEYEKPNQKADQQVLEKLQTPPENRTYSRGEIAVAQSTEFPGLIKRMAQSSDYSALESFRREFAADLDGKYGGGADYATNKGLKQGTLAARSLKNALEKIQKLKEALRTDRNATTSYAVSTQIVEELRNAAEAFKRAPAGEGSFKNACTKGARMIEGLINNNFRPGPDPLKSYVALNSDVTVGDSKEARLRCAARTAAAYQWARENGYKIGAKNNPSVDRAKLDRLGTDMLKDPLFREFLRDKTAVPQPKAAQPNGAQPEQEQYVVDEKLLEKTSLWSSHQLMADQLAHPLTYGAKEENQRAALKSLRELGDVLDHCSGAGKDYKRFFHGLKDLSLLDVDKMSGKEMGKKLEEIYKNTENYMKGKKAVSWFRNRREHFEQALDALACIRSVSPYAALMTQKLVDRTNKVRTNRVFKQETVKLEERNAVKTAKRLAECRGIMRTEQSNVLIEMAEKQFEGKKLVRASEAKKPEDLPKMPKEREKDGKNVLQLRDLRKDFNNFLTTRDKDYAAASKRVPEMLALTITPAYQYYNTIVVDKAEYERNVRVMRQHLASGVLVQEYSDGEKRKGLKNHAEETRCGVLRQEFNEKDQLIRAHIQQLDRKALGKEYEYGEEGAEKLKLLEKEIKLNPDEQKLLEKLQKDFGQKPQGKPGKSPKEQRLMEELQKKFRLDEKKGLKEEPQAEPEGPKPGRVSHL